MVSMLSLLFASLNQGSVDSTPEGKLIEDHSKLVEHSILKWFNTGITVISLYSRSFVD